MTENPKEELAKAPVKLNEEVIEKMKAILHRDETFFDVWTENRNLGISNNLIKDLEKHEKEVSRKVITAAHKFSTLKKEAKCLLISLKRIADMALVGFRCGVDDDKVYKTFEEDLEDEIMKETLDEVDSTNKAVKEALLDVEYSLEKLSGYCEERITQLPPEEIKAISEKRADYLYKIGGVLSLMYIPTAFHPAARIGAGLAGFAIGVTQTESDVSTIRETFRAATRHLQSGGEYWRQFQGKVVSLNDELTKFSKHWDSLRNKIQLSGGHLAYLLGALVKKDKVEFMTALDGIMQTCKKAIDSNVR